MIQLYMFAEYMLKTLEEFVRNATFSKYIWRKYLHIWSWPELSLEGKVSEVVAFFFACGHWHKANNFADDHGKGQLN